jgi:hypothetical protein
MIPNIFNIKRYLDVTFGYSVDYQWQDALTRGDLGKSAGFNNSVTFSMTLRLKQLIDPLFEEGPAAAGGAPSARGRRGGETEARPASDTTAAARDTTGGGFSRTLTRLKQLLKAVIKYPLLDYDNITITFNQTNSAQNSGVVGGPGFVNFWGRVPFFQESELRYGPSRLYQLGLLSDPSGKLTNFRFTGAFPFVAWDEVTGLRAPGGVLMNSYRQTNRVALKTSRSLWEGARVDLNWSVGWAYNRTQNLATDSTFGIPTITNASTTGSVDRSFLSFPEGGEQTVRRSEERRRRPQNRRGKTEPGLRGRFRGSPHPPESLRPACPTRQLDVPLGRAGEDSALREFRKPCIA